MTFQKGDKVTCINTHTQRINFPLKMGKIYEVKSVYKDKVSVYGYDCRFMKTRFELHESIYDRQYEKWDYV